MCGAFGSSVPYLFINKEESGLGRVAYDPVTLNIDYSVLNDKLDWTSLDDPVICVH